MKNYIKIIVALLLQSLLLPGTLQAVNYYVKTNGNNSNTGLNWAQSWRTIHFAATNQSTPIGPGDTVIVSNGNYTGNLSPAASGTEANPITYTSFNLNKAVIIGGSQGIYLNSIKHIRINGFFIKLPTSHGINLGGTSVSNTFSQNVICSNNGGWGYGVHMNNDGADYNSIISNTIFEYWGSGIFFDSGDYNLAFKNTVYKNSSAGIYIQYGANYNYILNNHIYSNADDGIDARAPSNTIASNDIHGPGQPTGINLSQGGANTVTGRNRIHHNDSYGINITCDNNTVNNNLIYSNGSYGINVGSGMGHDNNTITSNHIYGPNQDYGIRLYYNKYSRVSKNIIHNNDIYGIYLQALLWSEGTMVGTNVIYSNSSAGIYGFQADYTVIVSNKIFGPGQDHGIQIARGANTKIINNEIYDNNETGLFLHSDVTYNNDIVKNRISGSIQDNGIWISNCRRISARSNIIHHQSSSGIYLSGNSTNIMIEKNQIYSNSVNGILLTENSGYNTNINNLLYGNSQNGILFSGSGVQNNRVISNECYNNYSGIKFSGAQKNYITYNPKIHNNLYGISLEANSWSNWIAHNISYSNIGSANSSGMMVKENAYFVNWNAVVSNEFFDNTRGVTLTNAAQNYFVVNKCHNNINGIVIQGVATEDWFNNNDIYSNTEKGVLIDSGADVTTLLYNDIYKNDTGVYITNAERCQVVTNNRIDNNRCGIYVCGSSPENRISELNRIVSNSTEGIYLNGSGVSLTEIENNSAVKNNPIGIRIRNAITSAVYNNSISQNSNGIHFEGSANNNIVQLCSIYENTNGVLSTGTSADGNVVWNCTIRENTYGINSDSGDGNYYIGNSIYQNFNTGIRVVNDANNNRFQKNRVYKNNEGILIDGNSDTTLVINNTLFSNTGDGIDNASGTTILKNLITRGNALGINSSAAVTVSYSCINDSSNASVTMDGTCITSDPLFRDEASSTLNLHLRYNSPCIGTGEPNSEPGCMGAYTAYIRLADDTAGNITFATVFYTTALKVGSIPNDGKIKLYLDEDVFGLLNVTNIETTSIWGGSPGSFSLLVAFDPFDSFLTITRSGGNGSTPGQVENLIIQSLNNAAIGTNHTFDIETRPANDSLDYIEYETSHDFAIFGFDFYYVQWSTGNDSWPGTRNQPWKTIQHAADVLDPGEVVIVLPGTQLEQVVIRSNGNPWGQVISYIAEGNVIVTPNSNGKMVGGSSFIIDAADWIRIHGFKCTGGTNEGILIKNAERCILYSMEVYGNTFAGIRLENVHRSSIRYSQIYNNSKGIEMTNGRTNWLRGNLVYNNNTIGLDIKGEIKESLLYENEVNSNPMGGISIDGEDSDDNQIWRNYCHSGQLYGIMINGGDFNSITENTNQSCTNGVLISGSSFSNTVDNNRIIANVLNGILLTGSARRNSIQQNACSNNNNNISLTGTGSSNSITGNTCYGGTRGIQIVKARQNRIINNNISYMSTCGIRLGTNASLNTNRGNTIQFAVIGMQIESGTNILYNNSINSNSQKGIYLKGSSSSHNKIFQNNIFGGGQINGIEIDSGNNNLITDNNAIYGHNSYGIYLYGNSFSNTISGNDIYAKYGPGNIFIRNRRRL